MFRYLQEYFKYKKEEILNKLIYQGKFYFHGKQKYIFPLQDFNFHIKTILNIIFELPKNPKSLNSI